MPKAAAATEDAVLKSHSKSRVSDFTQETVNGITEKTKRILRGGDPFIHTWSTGTPNLPPSASSLPDNLWSGVEKERVVLGVKLL